MNDKILDNQTEDVLDKTKTGGNTSRKFRPDIEGLRAIAIIAVVLSHAEIGLYSGFIGVDIFFVISGFLITSHIFNEAKKQGTISLSNFYAKRILRILPASMFAILVTLLASFIWLSPLQLLSYANDALWSALSIFNYRLAIDGTDYFNTTTVPTPFQHFWSLAVEEQFYFIWPLIMLILAKIFGKKSYFGHLISLVLVLIIGFSLYLSYTVTATSQPWAYFGLHTRAWQMAIGALLAINIHRFANLKFAFVFSWIGFAGLVYALFSFTKNTPYPSFWAIIPTVATTIIIASGVNKNKYSFENIFGHSIFQFVGKISYSWYLIHWPLFVIFLLANNREGLSDKISIIILSFIISIVSFYTLENPIRHNLWIKSSLKNTYLVGLILVLITSAISGLVIYAKSRPAETKPVAIIPANETKLYQKIEDATKLQTLPKSAETSIEKTIIDGKSKECMFDHLAEDINSSKKCTIGSGKLKLALVGDSHARQWLDAMREIKNDYSLTTYLKSGCPIENIIVSNALAKRDYTECYVWRNNVLEDFKKEKFDVIVVASLEYEIEKSKYENSIKTLQGLTKKLIVLEDTPFPNKDIPECLIQNKADIKKCQFTYFLREKVAKSKLEKEDILTKNQIRYVKTIDLFCTNKICPTIIDDLMVYYDNSHITPNYVKYLSDILRQRLFD